MSLLWRPTPDAASTDRITAPAWLSRSRAVVLLLALVSLSLWGLAMTLLPGQRARPATNGYGDVDLYRETAARVAAGGNYYAAAVEVQLQHGYPTAPFLVVRLPTLTYLETALGPTGITVLLLTLAVLAMLAMLVRLAGVSMAERLGATLLLGASLSLCAIGPVAWFHDAWAGVLILLAILVRTDRRWLASVGLGFAAVCFRELALPFLLVMVVVSWPRRKEALAWCGAVVAFAGIYTLHALAVQAAQPFNPAQSNGWLDFGGWQFILASVATGSALALAPEVLPALLVPLALFGWLFAPRSLRAAPLTCAAFIVCFLVVGRADNTYWGLLYAALVLVGLAFAPRGLVASVRAAIRPSG